MEERYIAVDGVRADEIERRDAGSGFNVAAHVLVSAGLDVRARNLQNQLVGIGRADVQMVDRPATHTTDARRRNKPVLHDPPGVPDHSLDLPAAAHMQDLTAAQIFSIGELPRLDIVVGLVEDLQVRSAEFLRQCRQNGLLDLLG